MISLGYQPVTANVHLTSGSDFVQTITASVAWPAGAAVSLRIGADGTDPTGWTAFAATMTSTVASWDIPAATVLALVPGSRLGVRVVYSDATVPAIVWMLGSVVWHG